MQCARDVCGRRAEHDLAVSTDTLLNGIQWPQAHVITTTGIAHTSPHNSIIHNNVLQRRRLILITHGQ